MCKITQNQGIDCKRGTLHGKDETAYNNSLTRPSTYNNDDNVNNADSTTTSKGEKIFVIALLSYV